ncbi:hypothetical protein ALP22_200147 [Pseudomonas coronafaciens pv. porri]|nr:hypothetical protein ALO89_200206 [Pseudomonas coronafaciens pv. porri]RMU83421.1 hypothetical protein ALP22_200147 [Pseudomonas coronafaciens pv. porri]RMW06616.1 hypothetical protein ALO99_200056 [Pseudomonas coronafaciens pv. porri]
MQDSWCSSIWDGTQWLSGAAAREYRLRQAGGVETVIRNSSRKAAENATREALETVNGAINAVNNPKSNVVPVVRPAARRRSRKSGTDQAREKK